MPPKKPTQADEPEAAEDQVQEPEAVAEQPAEEAAVEPEADAGAVEPEAAEEAAEEPEVDPAIAELNASLRPMRAAEGEGSCDLYKTDKKGNILVPASDVPLMIEHGFVLADSDA